ILLTPLIVPGINDGQLEELIKFAKEHDLPLGIQNFLYYKTGRNPAKPWPWDRFYDLLKELEQKYQIKLILSPADFGIEYAPKLEKPFRTNEEITAVVVCSDRFPDSRIAVAKERTISIPNCNAQINKKVRIKLIRDKHNIFAGKVV
ncbi:MAG: radical SAM protein, partial [Candidatus Woesearchaeota archaeon]